MDSEVDHYVILGLPSGWEGTQLCEKDISKAYKLKALKLHPDKNPDDPNAHSKFQQLKTSYDILKDEKTRELVFDYLLWAKRGKVQSQEPIKRRKMMTDLHARVRAAFATDATVRAEVVERIARKLQRGY